MSVEALATAERMIPSWTNGSSVQKTINFRNINDIQFSKSSNSLGLSVKLLTMKFLGVFLNKICQLLYNTDLWILRSYWSFHSRAVNYCTILTCGYFVHTDHSTQEPSTIVQYWLVDTSFILIIPFKSRQLLYNTFGLWILRSLLETPVVLI
jgi:hypothetical protein